MKTLELLISGRVQGVGFRACIKKIAMNLGVCGEAMNIQDGRVRIVATGEPVLLDKFISMLYSCPRVVIREIAQGELPLTYFQEFSVVRASYQYTT